jgi:hypothetical protein
MLTVTQSRSFSPTPDEITITNTAFTWQMQHLHDVLSVMRNQEREYYSNRHQRGHYNPPPMYGRSNFVQWMSSVVDIFQLAPQIVATGMYFLDACCCCTSSTTSYSGRQVIDHTLYPLLGMTCLELAIKMHDTKLFPLDELVKMGSTPCSIKDLVDMEAKVMHWLQWKLNPPTPNCFIHQYGLLLEAILNHHYQGPYLSGTVQEITDEAIGLVRLCLYDPTIPPAVAGYAAFLVALEGHQLQHSLPMVCKHDFGRHLLNLTGLSASSPGLANAYQLLSMGHHPSLSHLGPEPLPRVASPTTTSLGYQRQHHDPYQQPMVSPPNQQAHWESMTRPVPMAALRPLDPPGRFESTHTTAHYGASTDSSSLSYASPLSMTDNCHHHHSTTNTAARSRGWQTGPVDPNHHQPQQRQQQQQEMIYSAGDDLGFEVTLNPFDDNCIVGGQDALELSKTLEGLSLNGWSPRNIMGA